MTLTLDTAVPSVRWMVFAAMTGLMGVWPAVRLSQGQVGFGRPAVGVALSDWLGLMLILQAVIWPLSLVARWPWWQAVWLDAALVAWSLTTAAVIAAGRAFPGTAARCVAMAAALLLVLGEPLATLLAQGVAAGPMRFTPIATLYAFTGPLDILDARPLQRQIVGVGLVAAAAWVALLGWSIGGRLGASAAPR